MFYDKLFSDEYLAEKKQREEEFMKSLDSLLQTNQPSDSFKYYYVGKDETGNLVEKDLDFYSSEAKKLMRKKQDQESMANDENSMEYDRGRTKAMLYGGSTGECEDNQEGSEEEKWYGGVKFEDKVEMISRIAECRPLDHREDLEEDE